MMRAVPLLPVLVPLLAVCVAAQEVEPSSNRADVTRGQVERKLRFLASDELSGRATGSAGSLEAARWMATLLSEAGVHPAGDTVDGERVFLQDIGLVGATGPAPRLLAGESPLALGRDYDLDDLVPGARELSVVVARAAADLPETPDPEVALFLDVGLRERRALLEAAGTPDGIGWGATVVRGRRRPGEVVEAIRLGGSATGRALRLRVHGDWAERFASGEVRTLSFATDGVEVLPAYNVVGVIPGVGTAARPELADEVVVLTAHYDHLGTRPARAGDAPDVDRIYNGADDDASGTVAVLEIAEGLAAGSSPARSVVVALVTGEERGLLGTRYYLEHPSLPLDRTICNLNFEMIGRPDALVGGPGRLWITGYERSNLGPALHAAGLEVHPDPRPEQNFFQRSDNFAFARIGIVAQSLSSYDLHDDYHHTSDEADTLDFEHLTAAVRIGLDAARRLADGAIDPVWLPGGDPSQPREER